MLRKIILVVSLVGIVAGCVTHTINSDGTVQSNVVDKTKLSNTYVDLAIEYQQHGTPQVALDRANLAITTQPNNSRAYMIRAMIYQQLGKNNDAETDFKKSLSLDDSYSEANVNYAVYLCDQKRYPEAQEHFMLALNNPLYVAPEVGYFSNGKCYFKQSNYVEANNYFLKSMSYRNVPQDVYIEMAKLQIVNQNYQLANYYINKFAGSQTPATMWLHIQILQALLDAGADGNKTREYVGYRNTLGQLLIRNYGDTKEAQQYLSRYNGSYKPIVKTTASPVESQVITPSGVVASAAFAPVTVTPKTTQSNNQTSNNLNPPVTIVSHTGSFMTDSDGRRYVIAKSNDNLYRIGLKYSISTTKLEQINNIRAAGMKNGMRVYLDPKNN